MLNSPSLLHQTKNLGNLIPEVLKPKGIKNERNSCYINCFLQSMLSIPSFLPLLKSHATNFQGQLALETVAFYDSYHHCSDVVSGTKLCSVLAQTLGSEFNGLQQQDVKELFDSFSNCLSRDSPCNSLAVSAFDVHVQSNDPFSSLFSFKVKKTSICGNCRRVSSLEEPYSYFVLNFPEEQTKQPLTCEDLLWYLFHEFVEKNCDECKNNTLHFKISRIVSLPRVLLMFFLRETFDKQVFLEESKRTDNKYPGAGVTRKLVTFTETPDLKEYLSPQIDQDVSFNLCSVSIHQGGNGIGHYVCYSKRDHWYFFSDQEFKQVSLDTVLKPSSGVTLLMYQVQRGLDPLSKNSHTSVSGYRASSHQDSSSCSMQKEPSKSGGEGESFSAKKNEDRDLHGDRDVESPPIPPSGSGASRTQTIVSISFEFFLFFVYLAIYLFRRSLQHRSPPLSRRILI